MSSETHGSEDVNDFLQRIKELGNRRDQEDEERTRKLEEEILQGRKERQARRSGELHFSPCAPDPYGRISTVALQRRALGCQKSADREYIRTRPIHFPNKIIACEYADRIQDISGPARRLLPNIVPKDRSRNWLGAPTRACD